MSQKEEFLAFIAGLCQADLSVQRSYSKVGDAASEIERRSFSNDSVTDAD